MHHRKPSRAGTRATLDSTERKIASLHHTIAGARNILAGISAHELHDDPPSPERAEEVHRRLDYLRSNLIGLETALANVLDEAGWVEEGGD